MPAKQNSSKISSKFKVGNGRSFRNGGPVTGSITAIHTRQTVIKCLCKHYYLWTNSKLQMLSNRSLQKRLLSKTIVGYFKRSRLLWNSFGLIGKTTQRRWQKLLSASDDNVTKPPDKSKVEMWRGSEAEGLLNFIILTGVASSLQIVRHAARQKEAFRWDYYALLTSN